MIFRSGIGLEPSLVPEGGLRNHLPHLRPGSPWRQEQRPRGRQLPQLPERVLLPVLRQLAPGHDLPGERGQPDGREEEVEPGGRGGRVVVGGGVVDGGRGHPGPGSGRRDQTVSHVLRPHREGRWVRSDDVQEV